jgi:hypothetical protein
MIGERFHRLIVIAEAEPLIWNGQRFKKYFCICDCGNKIIAYPSNLKRGNTKSCGCWKKETAGNSVRTHARSGTREYQIWAGIKKRCYNKKSSMYPYYGARGIKMAPEWINDFEQFISDMGEMPSPKHSIDRINCNGDYTLNNCRWATPLQQTLNRKCAILIQTPFGEIHLKTLSQQLNWSYYTLYDWFIRQRLSYENVLDKISLITSKRAASNPSTG